MGKEQRRRAQFKQPLQDMEHSGVVDLRSHIAAQIRATGTPVRGRPVSYA